MPATPAPGLRILVVEDDADIAESVKALLEWGIAGAEVTTAPDGAEALRVLPAVSPHVIVSDYRMFGMDGVAFLKAAREQAPTAPRILMTAYPEMEVALEAGNGAHVESLLPKPLDPEEVLAKVSGLLARQAQDREGGRALARSASRLAQAMEERIRTLNP
jgi:CheY-like chemotaxis protein